MDSHLYRYEKGKFYGCYCLVSTSPRYKGRTYIGFTVNPNRRIQQHNGGYLKGGAKKTSGRGPWDMVLIIHGFPNEISALRFEWAWQNPEKSLRLKQVFTKKPGFSFQAKFNVVCEMLRTGPWCRLPLVIRWLRQEYKVQFKPNKLPPFHMPTVFGLVEIYAKKVKKNKTIGGSQISGTQRSCTQISNSQRSQHSDAALQCFLCSKEILKEAILFDKILSVCKCLNCNVFNHLTCMAKHFLNSDTDAFATQSTKSVSQIVPVDGPCPRCEAHLMWGELIRRGISKNLDEECDTAECLSDDEDDFVERNEDEDDEDEDFEETD